MITKKKKIAFKAAEKLTVGQEVDIQTAACGTTNISGLFVDDGNQEWHFPLNGQSSQKVIHFGEMRSCKGMGFKEGIRT